MPIPVECQCKHVTMAPESRAGLSVLCEGCGRTVVVPRPEGMESTEIEAAKVAEQEERSHGSFGRSLVLWLEGTVLANKFVSALILLGLILAVMLVLMLAGAFSTPEAVDPPDRDFKGDIRKSLDREHYMEQTKLIERAKKDIQEGKKDDARRALEACIEIKPRSPEAKKAKDMLQTLSNE